MGSFSFLKADNLTKIANIVYNKPYKFLIPAKYGGGYIKACYSDYGEIKITVDGEEAVYDMYEILAVWNHLLLKENGCHVELTYDMIRIPNKEGFHKVVNFLPKISEKTNHNRNLGLDLEFSGDYFNPLVFPLKLVSCSYKGTYEKCEGVSIADPNQGFPALKRENMNNDYPGLTYESMLRRVKKAEEEFIAQFFKKPYEYKKKFYENNVYAFTALAAHKRVFNIISQHLIQELGLGETKTTGLDKITNKEQTENGLAVDESIEAVEKDVYKRKSKEESEKEETTKEESLFTSISNSLNGKYETLLNELKQSREFYGKALDCNLKSIEQNAKVLELLMKMIEVTEEIRNKFN